MTGVLHAMVAQRVSIRIDITVGSDGSARGFVSGSYGSVSPATFLGATILQAQEAIVSGNFTFRLNGVVSSSLFPSVTIQQGSAAGGSVTVQSSSATYSNPSGTTSQWIWSDPGINWLVGDESTVRSLTFDF